jgi:hypothetical protein
MESYLRHVEKNHLLNYANFYVKIKQTGDYAADVMKAMDEFADVFESNSKLCGEFLVIAEGRKEDRKELMKVIAKNILKSNLVILQMKPKLEQMFTTLFSLTAIAEKELRDIKRVIRR